MPLRIVVMKALKRRMGRHSIRTHDISRNLDPKYVSHSGKPFEKEALFNSTIAITTVAACIRNLPEGSVASSAAGSEFRPATWLVDAIGWDVTHRCLRA